MGGIALFIFLFASPALVVAGMVRLGAMRRRVSTITAIIAASRAPGLLVFFGTRQADAITNAAAYYAAPMFRVYGFLFAAVTIAICSAFPK